MCFFPLNIFFPPTAGCYSAFTRCAHLKLNAFWKEEILEIKQRSGHRLVILLTEGCGLKHNHHFVLKYLKCSNLVLS